MKHSGVLSYQNETYIKDIPKQNIVDLNPTADTVRKNHMLTSSQELMYIMADVGYMT